MIQNINCSSTLENGDICELNILRKSLKYIQMNYINFKAVAVSNR